MDRTIELPSDLVTDDLLKRLACFSCDLYNDCPCSWDEGVNGDGKCENNLEKAIKFVKKI